MICIDFGLLRSLYCKISYSLNAEVHWSHTHLGIWQPTYDSVCRDNSWIHGKCRQRFYPNVYKCFFFSTFFFTFLTFFLFPSQCLLHIWLLRLRGGLSFNHVKTFCEVKMHKIHVRPGLRPGPTWGSLRRSPYSLIGWGQIPPHPFQLHLTPAAPRPLPHL